MKFTNLNFLTKLCLIWGLFWGALSFAVYFLGLAGLWYEQVFWGITGLFLVILVWYLRKTKINQGAQRFFKSLPAVFKKEKFLLVPIILFLIFIALNFIGAIAPEKEFDALWYHLTIPKIYLSDHRVHFIPGNLFYYSAMPRLAEMLYGWALSFDLSGILAKLVHFSFGVMWALFSYQILRIIFTRTSSAWLMLAIYSLFIVSHLSGTAYIDLIVSFYVAGAIWGFLSYLKTRQKNYLILMAIFLGLNLAAKLYGALITVVLGGYLLIENLILRRQWRGLIIAILIVIAVPLVYYLNAYLATGNPIYPVFSIRDSSFDLWIRGASTYRDWVLHIWPTRVAGLFWWAMVQAFVPIFGLIFLLPLASPKKNPLILPIATTFLTFFVFWSLLPVWEPRYLMVALPLLAILVGWVIATFKSLWFKIGVAILIGWGLIYNFNLSYKNFEHPMELAQGKITRSEYLNKYIGNVWYNFYDTDGFLAKNLAPGERILTVNFHNLFYAPAGFVDWSTLEQINSTEDLTNFMKRNNMRYIAFNKIEKIPWPNFRKEDLDKYFEVAWENSERVYFVIK